MKCRVCQQEVDINSDIEPLWIAYDGQDAFHMACADMAVSVLIDMAKSTEGMSSLANAIFREARESLGIDA